MPLKCNKKYGPMRPLILAVALLFPTAALAVGSDDDTPATPTQTTTECTDGKVWDEKSESCRTPRESRLDDDTLYRAAREFAYAGQFGHALGALAAMSDQHDDRVLTYKGFAHRKSGDTALGMQYYVQAIVKNPDNLLARSYMGQAFVEAGDLDAAKAQLAEIRARGGRQSWSAFALKSAIAAGPSKAY